MPEFETRQDVKDYLEDNSLEDLVTGYGRTGEKCMPDEQMKVLFDLCQNAMDAFTREIGKSNYE